MDNFPYQLKTVERHLTEIGYSKPTGSTVLNYEFIVDRNEQPWKTDLMAFGDPQRFDISTSCIAVQWWPNGGDKSVALQSLRHIGAPIALFATPDQVEIWSVSSESETIRQPKEAWSYDRLSGYFSDHKRDLAPHSVLQAKKGERQLTFFDIDSSLETFARQATQETLAEQFMETIATVPHTIRQHYPKELTRVVISVLAARILQDKLIEYPDLQVRDIESLLQTLQTRFPNYFTDITSDIKEIGYETLNLLYQGLLGGFTFRSLTNDMLAYFYENVFVDKQLQRELGIYYTPRYITERILKHLPIEDLPPEDRAVLDGTCGSGNMLLAAYDRLSKLLPVRWSLEKCHNYLLDHILGIDVDPFACEIARLSLLLYDLPMGDSWQVEKADVFHVMPAQIFNKKPTIIVSNPPFEHLSTEGKRIQIAAEVLKKYLDWLPANGLLGIIVPLTFLNNASVLNVRKRLLTECDILEVWHLLQGAVSHWSTSTAIILARKLPEKEYNTGNDLTRVIEVIGTDRQEFEHFDYPTFSYVVPQLRWLKHPRFSMDSSVIDPTCDSINQRFSPIHENYAFLADGVKPGPRARPTHFSYRPTGDINRKTLYNNRDGKKLEPYRIDWKSQHYRYIKYPGNLERPREEWHFEQPIKVIFNSIRNSGGPWHFYAAIDKDKLIPTENFCYALSTTEASAEEITSVLNSSVANAWYASRYQGSNINLTLLKQLPFPTFDKKQKERIRHLVKSITNLKKQIQNTALEKIRSYILELDKIVFDAYELSQEERQQLTEWIETSPRPRPGVEWTDASNYQARPQKQSYQGRRWILTGEVKSINNEKQSLSIQIDDREIEIPIPSGMPGWVLRPYVVFEATVPWHQADNEDLSAMTWLDFEPLGYDYLTDDELFTNLIDNLITE